MILGVNISDPDVDGDTGEVSLDTAASATTTELNRMKNVSDI